MYKSQGKTNCEPPCPKISKEFQDNGSRTLNQAWGLSESNPDPDPGDLVPLSEADFTHLSASLELDM